MTEDKIKAEDIEIEDISIETEYRKDDEDFNEVYKKYCILIIDNDDKTAEILKQQILKNQEIVDFLNEIEEQDWELDADDIKHVLTMDFDYIRKQQSLSNVREK